MTLEELKNEISYIYGGAIKEYADKIIMILIM